MLSAVYAVIVCLCVSLSVILRYCIKTAKRRITQITPFSDAKDHGKIKYVTFDEKRAITRKRYNIDVLFLLKLNRKSYALYQMAMFPMTLGDP